MPAFGEYWLMAKVGFYNNWDTILDKLENILRSEFKATLKIYRGVLNIPEGNNYLRIVPTGSEHVDYSSSLDIREFSFNLILHFRNTNSSKSGMNQAMRLISRLETILGNNMAITLADQSMAYNSRVESTEINVDNPDEYVITLDYKCIHANDITSDTTAPTMTITSSQVSDGDSSFHSTLSMTFTSSEVTNDFIESDITLGNASLSNFTAVAGGKVYTATLTPSADGAVTVDVLANKFTDFAGNQNTATTQFNWTKTANTYSLLFNGTNERVETEADDTLASRTYSFWAKSSETDRNRGVFAHGNSTGAYRVGGFHFNYDDDNNPTIFMGANRWRKFTDTSAQDDGDWHHWMVYLHKDDMTATKCFVDGVALGVASTSNIGGYEPYVEGLRFGGDGGNNFFGGQLDEFAVFTGDKTDNASTYYNSGKSYWLGDEDDLVGYWRMETITGGDTVADESGEGNNATLINTPTHTTDAPY